MLASISAHCSSELLSSEVDLDVRILHEMICTILSNNSVSWVRLAVIGLTMIDIMIESYYIKIEHTWIYVK